MHDIFYFTDVHGYYPLYKAAIDYCMKKDPECTIIYGGDACDRGLDGYKIMRELLDNPQVVYMKGNHEDMFVAAARFIMNDLSKPLSYEEAENYLYSAYLRDFAIQVQDCIYNGGSKTLAAWIADGMPNDFVTSISKLPLTFSTDTMDFCHAGSEPKVFNNVANAEYRHDFPDKDDEMELLWDRLKLGYGWTPNRICVYGHTPVPHLPAKYYSVDKTYDRAHPCKYYGLLDDRLTGAKIAMDVGTARNGKLYVLNCLTLQAIGFKDTDFENNEIKNHDVEQFEVIQL